MSLLHLVRHGLPVVDETKPNAAWLLAPEASAAIDALRTSGRLPSNGARWFSSPEPKALGTAQALASSSVSVMDGLREMERRAGPWLGADEWSAAVARSMTESSTPAQDGWETATATTSRVLGTVTRIRESCVGEDLVLVGHGTAWTLLVAALTASPPDLAGWERMGLPDHLVLDLAGDPASVTVDWHGTWE